MLLVGDIGGTKTVLMVFESPANVRTPVVEQSYPSAHYSNLEDIVKAFLDEHKLPVRWACFGVAGPVIAGRSQITNLPWVMDETTLARDLGLERVRLLNDLEALAWAVPQLEAEDLTTLNVGQRQSHGAIGVVAPGTGLGTGFLTWDGSGYRAHPSEGGHADFAPTNTTELDMLRFLWNTHPQVGYELLCSGLGLPNIYAYVKSSGSIEPEWLAAELAAATDKTPVIVNAALARPDECPIAVATLDIFVGVLASAAGNLAVNLVAMGGIYIGGGIPPRILHLLTEPRFMQAFVNRDRQASLLQQVPIHVIRNPKAALLGSAYVGFSLAS